MICFHIDEVEKAHFQTVSKTGCGVGSRKMIGGSHKAHETTIGWKAKKQQLDFTWSMVAQESTASVGGFHARYSFSCDGATCVGVEDIWKQLVYVGSKDGLASARSTTAAAAGKNGWRKCDVTPRSLRLDETQMKSSRWRQQKLDRE